jgi:FkbM family methyltransferase
MTNDPREMSGTRLQNALHTLGRNPELRAELIALLKKMENKLECPGTAVRDDITGPIIDALHDDTDVYEKILSDGTRFRFLFRTKIARDFLLSNQVHPDHVWEPQTTRLMLNLAERQSGDVVVGGAYFGDQAIMVAKKIIERNGVLHGFEPNPDQAGMFKQNVSINNLPNVRVRHLGLWSESSVKLKLDGFDSFANAVQAGAGDEGFQTISIDDYRQQYDLHIGLIQLDIEGAELAALKGAVQTLKQDHPDIVFEVHRSYVDWSQGLEKTEICNFLSKLGYKIYALRDFNSHYDMKDKCIELIPVDKVHLEGPPHGFNMVAVMNDVCFTSDMYRIVENVSPKLLLHKDPVLHHPKDGL